MTLAEYEFSGCGNHHSRFTHKDGTTFTGVVATFFVGEPENYRFVPTKRMQEFKVPMANNDYTRMRELSEEIDLSDIVSAIRI